jgi:protein TorT
MKKHQSDQFQFPWLVSLVFLMAATWSIFTWGDEAPPQLANRFDPIPVYAIFPPLKPMGSADDALTSGRVIQEKFSMAAPATKHWRIAYLFPHIKDPYWIGCSYGVISEAKRLGITVDIYPADGYDDLIGQLHKMAEVTEAKYDAIVISPISLTANNSAIAKARSMGIPVFELANDSTTDDLTIKVTTSLRSMGFDATNWIIDDAKRRGLKTVNIALLPGPTGAGWVKGEVDGTRAAVQKSGSIKVNIVDIKYGDSDRVGQSRLAAELLSEHGSEIDYILGCSGCAPAARLPLQEAHLTNKIRIVAYDLTREIATLIRSGEIKAAADTKAVSQARVVTDAAVNYLEGRTKNLPHTILIKVGLVNVNNFAQYGFDTSIAPTGYTPILSYSPPQH